MNFDRKFKSVRFLPLNTNFLTSSCLTPSESFSSASEILLKTELLRFVLPSSVLELDELLTAPCSVLRLPAPNGSRSRTTPGLPRIEFGLYGSHKLSFCPSSVSFSISSSCSLLSFLSNLYSSVLELPPRKSSALDFLLTAFWI
jgi:hypothetical protein